MIASYSAVEVSVFWTKVIELVCTVHHRKHAGCRASKYLVVMKPLLYDLLQCVLSFSTKDATLTKFLRPCFKSNLTSTNFGVFKIKTKDFKALLAWQMHFYEAHIPK